MVWTMLSKQLRVIATVKMSIWNDFKSAWKHFFKHLESHGRYQLLESFVWFCLPCMVSFYHFFLFLVAPFFFDFLKPPASYRQQQKRWMCNKTIKEHKQSQSQRNRIWIYLFVKSICRSAGQFLPTFSDVYLERGNSLLRMARSI